MKRHVRDERGAVLVIVALVMSVLLTLSAGGIMLFTLYGSQREMQKAADQAALAGAAALPLLRPGQVLNAVPGLNTVYDLTDNVGLDVPLKSLGGIPDPRAVACAYGSASMTAPSANLIDSFGSAPNPAPSTPCASAPWSDNRITPSLNSLSTPLSTCVNSLTTSIQGVITQLTNSLNGLLCLPLLGCVLSTVTTAVNSTIARLQAVLLSVQNLEALSPALLTPKMTVTVKSGVNPPMLSFITGNDGVQMEVTSTAERRLKNAVVLPNTSALTGVNLNTALATTKPAVMDALAAANTQLNGLFTGLGLSGCQNLLSPTDKIVQDISDIYNPPASGVGPTGADLLRGASASATRAAGQAGTSVDALAGEAFLVIRQGATPTTISGLLGPVFSLLGLSGTVGLLQVPAVDVAVVAAHNLEDGNISNPDLIADAVSARGLFTATLVQ
jgi:Flp pilus assembly protein TadG